LVVTGSSQIKVYDRDGIARGESVRGDMYIRDARNTKGHVSPTTSGHWHPSDRCVIDLVFFISSSTCRKDAKMGLFAGIQGLLQVRTGQ
jgi:hypothetical protein